MTTTNAINAPIPFSATLGGTGLVNPTAHGILVGEGASAITPITLTNGQLLIGSTGADPVAASLTAGANITITPSAGGVTIASSAGTSWVNVTATSQAMSVNTGYIANNAALVTLTLPATAAIGSEIKVLGTGAGGWLIAQNSGQSIKFGNVSTTAGTGGSLASTNANDGLTLICTTTNTGFTVFPVAQSITYV